MHKVDNFDKKPFEELLDFLENMDISVSEYQAYEYFVRNALDNFSHATSFPDENFKVKATVSNLKRLWENFKNDHGGRVNWGFHPLSNNRPDFHNHLKQFEENLVQLVNSLPNGDEFPELVSLRINVRRDVNAIKRKVDNIHLMTEKTKFYKEQETAYLTVSKFFAKKFFEKYGINSLVDEFINIKYRCYFQDSMILEKSTIVQRMNRFSEIKPLIAFLENYCDTIGCESVMVEFERNRSRWVPR